MYPVKKHAGGFARRIAAAAAVCLVCAGSALAQSYPPAPAPYGSAAQNPAPAAATAPAAAPPVVQASAAQNPNSESPNQYSMKEVIDSGNNFFGSTSGGLAKAVETIFKRYGLPNGYIQGQEASGAFILGLTYGEGVLYTKNAGDHKMFWQGPSVGFDAGGNGSRTMILVYKLRDVNTMWGRYGGVSGSAYFVAGVSFNVLSRQGVLLVPIRTGIGARLGVNINYLKVTSKATWNPL